MNGPMPSIQARTLMNECQGDALADCNGTANPWVSGRGVYDSHWQPQMCKHVIQHRSSIGVQCLVVELLC